MIIHNGGPLLSHPELVLFPFDSHALPFQNGVELNLIGHTSPPDRTKIVVGLGDAQAPDSKQVVYYGSVHRVGDELWMWYLGQGDDVDVWFERVCLATSRDGIHWEKPALGLVEYKGSKQNNLVDLNQGTHHVQACVVFYEPDEPDPQRRFKMAFECDKYDKVFAVAYSADGLTWHESPNNPVGRWYEMAGGTRFNGCYYLSGQGGNHAGGMRQLVTYVSYDFEQWSEASCMGLRRAFSIHQPRPFGRNAGEQVHLGAALWNRGNILIGFYGMWHGHISNDRRLLTMDLGLAVSTDALHYHEPLPDFPIVSAAEDGWGRPPHGHTAVHFPALIQGQGFENIGDQTLFWYAPWPEQKSDGVRVAIWQRDRLSYFRAFKGQRMRTIEEAHFVSAPIELEGRAAELLLNIDGLSAHSGITVELLNERFEPLPGYGVEQCLAPSAEGLAQVVRWQGQESIQHTAGPIRVRVNFTGIRAEDVRLYAVYLREVTAADGQ